MLPLTHTIILFDLDFYIKLLKKNNLEDFEGFFCRPLLLKEVTDTPSLCLVKQITGK